MSSIVSLQVGRRVGEVDDKHIVVVVTLHIVIGVTGNEAADGGFFELMDLNHFFSRPPPKNNANTHATKRTS